MKTTRTQPLWISLTALVVAACSAADDGSYYEDPGGDDPAFEEGAEQEEPGPPEDDCLDCTPDPDPGEDGGESGSEEPPLPDTAPGQVCYPGPGGANDACVQLVPWSAAWGAAYQYPQHSSSQYQPPLRFVDLTTADGGLQIADNFVLSEVMQEWKGPYGVFQPHVVEKLQWLRNQIGGPLYINSAYRSPAYNRSVDGATYSRHMYGDAADIRSNSASLSQIRSLCQQLDAGYIGMYSSFVHCDWRNKPLEPAFFAPFTVGLEEDIAWQETLPIHTATLEPEADGLTWTAPATGFDEDEPLRIWTAYDTAGNVIETSEGSEYEPPAGAHRLHVWVGGHVEVEVQLD